MANVTLLPRAPQRDPGRQTRLGVGERETESTRPLGWIFTDPGGLERTSPQRALRMFPSPALPKLKSRQKKVCREERPLDPGLQLGTSIDFTEPLRRKKEPSRRGKAFSPPTILSSPCPGSSLAFLARLESRWLGRGKGNVPSSQVQPTT